MKHSPSSSTSLFVVNIWIVVHNFPNELFIISSDIRYIIGVEKRSEKITEKRKRFSANCRHEMKYPHSKLIVASKWKIMFLVDLISTYCGVPGTSFILLMVKVYGILVQHCDFWMKAYSLVTIMALVLRRLTYCPCWLSSILWTCFESNTSKGSAHSFPMVSITFDRISSHHLIVLNIIFTYGE